MICLTILDKSGRTDIELFQFMLLNIKSGRKDTRLRRNKKFLTEIVCKMKNKIVDFNSN
jgi:hypothetical protein